LAEWFARGSGAPIFDSVFLGSMPERWLGGWNQLKSAVKLINGKNRGKNRKLLKKKCKIFIGKIFYLS
jgi:hypothetical protein